KPAPRPDLASSPYLWSPGTPSLAALSPPPRGRHAPPHAAPPAPRPAAPPPPVPGPAPAAPPPPARRARSRAPPAGPRPAPAPPRAQPPGRVPLPRRPFHHAGPLPRPDRARGARQDALGDQHRARAPQARLPRALHHHARAPHPGPARRRPRRAGEGPPPLHPERPLGPGRIRVPARRPGDRPDPLRGDRHPLREEGDDRHVEQELDRVGPRAPRQRARRRARRPAHAPRRRLLPQGRELPDPRQAAHRIAGAAAGSGARR